MQNFQHRHLWRGTENEAEMENGPRGGGLSYQDENSTEVLVQTHESTMQTRLQRDGQDCVRVAAGVVEGIKK